MQICRRYSIHWFTQVATALVCDVVCPIYYKVSFFSFNMKRFGGETKLGSTKIKLRIPKYQESHKKKPSFEDKVWSRKSQKGCYALLVGLNECSSSSYVEDDLAMFANILGCHDPAVTTSL